MSNYNKTIFREFNEAREFVIALNLKNKQEWQLFAASINRPKDIPFHPEKTYKNKGWKNFGFWVGHYPKLSRSREYVTFENAKKIVKSLKLNTLRDWQKFDYNKRIELKLPASPQVVYKDKWISWSDWLGTNNISNKKKTYLSFEDAKKLIQTLGLKGQQEYFEYVKLIGHKQNLPQSPDRFYKNKGWISTPDFLGYKTTKRELCEQKFLYFYDLGNDVLGYGITYQIHKRNIEHRVEAKKVGYKINRISYFKFNDGRIAVEIERHFRLKYPAKKIPIKGFKTENTSMFYFEEMIKYVKTKKSS